MISGTSNHEAPGIKRGYDRSNDREITPGDVEFHETTKQHHLREYAVICLSVNISTSQTATLSVNAAWYSLLA
jgi:hypothetical protein